MTLRQALICDSCRVKTITRTSVGYSERQQYVFPCPGCGIEISYFLEADHRNVTARLSDPINAKWTDSEEGAIKVLSFNAEFPTPKGLPDFISPFIATVHNISNLKAYARDEKLRRSWIEDGWPYCERLQIHYKNCDWALFDKAAGLDRDDTPDAESRLRLLGQATERGFNYFTLDTPAQRARIQQRIALAQSISVTLFRQLAQDYASSGRISALWKQVTAVRRSFIKIYPAVSPLIQMRYWKQCRRDLADFALAVKSFVELKAFLIDCYETLCKLLAIAAGIEGIICLNSLEVPTKKGRMAVWEFEAMDNGNKHTVLKRLAIADLFLPVLNHAELRNGVGHHSAHYDEVRDEVIYYRFKGHRQVEKRLAYTEFCDFCLALFTAFELATIYFQALHLRVKGAM